MRHTLLIVVTDLEQGGTPSVVYELATRLSGGGVGVQVVCLKGFGPVAQRLAEVDVAVDSLGMRGMADLPRAARRLVTLAGRHRPQTVLSFLIHANLLTWFARPWLGDVRWVQSIQTTQERPAWHWLVQRIIAPAADRFVVPSPSIVRAAAERSGIGAERCDVIANAVDSLRRPERSAGSEVNVGFLGRLDPIKNVSVLIEAMALLPDTWRCEVYGDGPMRQPWQQHAEALGLADRIAFRGAVDGPAQALAAMDVLVLPSHAEGFGLVLIEAMSAGVPVVAADAPGIRDVVQHGENGLLYAGGPAELAAALRRVLSDLPLRERLMAGGRRAVVERYSWARVLPEWKAALFP